MPAHRRMRAFDRDLIRGGHYGQRPRVSHLKAEHMAAPTKAANVKKVLANSEPSTHDFKVDIGDHGIHGEQCNGKWGGPWQH